MIKQLFFVGHSADRPMPGERKILPVSDGQFFTALMDQQLEKAVAIIEFYSDAGGTQVVAPSAGTYLFEGCPTPSQLSWHTSGDDGACSASDINAEMPSFFGPMLYGRLTLSGIVGASHFSAGLWRF